MNRCVRATAYAALDRGDDVMLLEDAPTTSGIDLGDGETVEAMDFAALRERSA